MALSYVGILFLSLQIQIAPLLPVTGVPLLPAEKLPDLVLAEIFQPTWETQPVRRSVIRVRVANQGGAPSPVSSVWIRDLDPSRKDYSRFRRIRSRETRNTLMGMINSPGEDRYFLRIAHLPALKPGESKTVTVYLNDHWVFDPDCELEATVDYTQTIREENEYNNTAFFGKKG